MPAQKWNGAVSMPAASEKKSIVREYIPGIPARDLSAAEHAKYGAAIAAAARGGTLFEDKPGEPPAAPAPKGKAKK